MVKDSVRVAETTFMHRSHVFELPVIKCINLKRVSLDTQFIYHVRKIHKTFIVTAVSSDISSAILCTRNLVTVK